MVLALALEPFFVYKDKGPRHDFIDRTGHDWLGNVYAKSMGVFTNGEKDECVLRGYIKYINNRPDFVIVNKDNTDYPNLLVRLGHMKNNIFGPSKFPSQKETQNVGHDPEICNGKKCCIVDEQEHDPTQAFFGINGISKSLQFICKPQYVYSPKESEEKCKNSSPALDLGIPVKYCGHDTIDGKQYSAEFMKSCSCLTSKNDQLTSNKYGGLGLDCTDILPGGKHHGKWDVYKQYSWALNKVANMRPGKFRCHSKSFYPVRVPEKGNPNGKMINHYKCHRPCDPATERCLIPLVKNMDTMYGLRMVRDGPVSRPSLFWWGGSF